MKYLEVDDDDQEPESLPIRGAWIEIRGGGNSEHEQARRSPSGERGLKCILEQRRRITNLSLPIRGAWIEIYPHKPNKKARKVAPHPGSVD